MGEILLGYLIGIGIWVAVHYIVTKLAVKNGVLDALKHSGYGNENKSSDGGGKEIWTDKPPTIGG